MKLIIAGSRTLIFPVELIEYIRQTFTLRPSEIISGGAKGVDAIGEEFSKKYNHNLKVFKANWDKFGKKAGPLRNKEMADYADALLLIWDGSSSGSANMKRQMEDLGKLVYEIIINNPNTTGWDI